MTWLIETIATPLGALMRLCWNWLGDYGLAIILFTLLTKIILLPVSLLVQKNSIIMVKMKPQLDALRFKFADDSDRYLDEQVALYKREHYHPLSGVLPLLIQVPIILGLINVVYQPLRHLLHLSSAALNALNSAAVNMVGADLGSSPQLKVVELLGSPETSEKFIHTLNGNLPNASEILAIISGMKLDFLGLNLAAIPSLTKPNMLLLIPILAGVSAWGLSYFQNRDNVLQIEQSRSSKVGMTLFLIAFSTFFAFLVPAGVGLYWIASNLLAIPFIYLVNAIYDPKKHIDYNYLERVKRIQTERRELQRQNSKRERADYHRFCRDETQETMQLMFYSEQSGFYKYFENIIHALIESSDVVIHYVTNDPNDAIFTKREKQLIPYYVGEKRLIPLMMKVEADIVVMTVPDLEKYHIKRSRVRKDVEYIYVDHGGTSLNLTYRAGALDYFDTIFAVNKSQVEEIRAMEALRKTKKKTIVECGYGLIDNMTTAFAAQKQTVNDRPTILVAPSWAEDNIMDSCLDALLSSLLCGRYRVIIRPHPQYVRRFPVSMDEILERYRPRFDEYFSIETDFSSNVTVLTADLVITDWSAIGYEFCFATERPTLFVNTKMKAINPDWQKINVVPFEIHARNLVGCSLEKNESDQAANFVDKLIREREVYAERIRLLKSDFLFNIGHSGEVGADYILSQLSKKPKR